MANFVETEQLVEIETPKGKAVSSFVQVHTPPQTPSQLLNPQCKFLQSQRPPVILSLRLSVLIDLMQGSHHVQWLMRRLCP